MAGSIDEYTFLMMIEQLDVNHDGIISKDEFKIPYMRLKKDLTDAEYDVLGANFEAIDHGGNKPATLAAKAGRKKSKELLEEALVK